MTHFKHVIKLLLVNGLILLAGVLVIELAFGGWINEKRLNRLNLLKDCTLKYDVTHLYPHATPTIRYTRDRYGLRGSYGTPDQIDILTVGGSTTDQRYIGDGETWQDALAERFHQAGQDVSVANAGVDGQSTYGHLANFTWWFPNIPGLRPSYVLFYVGLNDFHKEEGYSFDRLAMDEGGLKNEIKKNSAVWHLVRTARGAYSAMVVKKIGHRSTDFAGIAWADRPLLSNYDFMDGRLEEYESRLRALADMTREMGARPVFVTQPSRRYRVTAGVVQGESKTAVYDGHEFNGVDYYYMMKRLDAVTAKVGGDSGAVFIDAASYAGWDDADFYDFEHMTPDGAQKVGVVLYDALKDVVIVSPRQMSAD